MSDWIDISVPLHPGIEVWPGDPPFSISCENKGDYVLSTMTMTVHTGTHVDAPLHFLRSAPAIDSVPLDALVGEARVIEPGAIGGARTGDRVLIKTPGIDMDAARLLFERRVRAVGVAGLSVGSTEVHRLLMGAGIWIIETLDLARVEPGRYEMICLPLLITGAEAAPARALLRRI